MEVGIVRPTFDLVEGLVRDAVREFLPTVPAARDADFVEQTRLLDERLGFQDAAERAALYRTELARSANAPAPECSVLLISGCQDNQTSSDGRPDPSGHQNGAFTRALRNVWESLGKYDGVAIVEFPDNESCAACSLTLTRAGSNTTLTTTVLLSPDEGYRAMQKANMTSTGYRAPVGYSSHG